MTKEDLVLYIFSILDAHVDWYLPSDAQILNEPNIDGLTAKRAAANLSIYDTLGTLETLRDCCSEVTNKKGYTRIYNYGGKTIRICHDCLEDLEEKDIDQIISYKVLING